MPTYVIQLYTVRTYVILYTYLHASDGSDDDDDEATPLIKPTNDPDISKALTATATTGNRNSTKWLQHKAINFFKAFCIPGVVVVRYRHM